MRNDKEYLYYLRALAIIAVVLLHVAASVSLERFENTNISYWWIQNLINSLTRWCVPIFFMISGALLLSNKEECSTKDFLKKRLSRILIPAVTFGIGYLIFDYICYGQVVDLKRFIQTGPKWHMWFIYAMIPLYLLAPMLQKSIKCLKKRDLVYLSMIMIMLTSGIDFLNVVFKMNLNGYISLPVLNMFLIYFILGYVIQTISLSRKSRYTVYILGIIGYMITVFGTYQYTSLMNGTLNTYFYSYTTLNVVVMSLAIMLLFKSIYVESLRKGIKRLGKSIANESYTIYLIHVMILELFRIIKFPLFEEVVTPIIRVPVMTVLIFGISYMISLGLHKIPIIKKLV